MKFNIEKHLVLIDPISYHNNMLIYISVSGEGSQKAKAKAKKVNKCLIGLHIMRVRLG